ncbi:MAG: Cyclic di-GMP phosphodiesterase response regulator RpfG [Nitrospira sp.]|nr:Cyclic di-GMP phosphodiesterase response regulator RpfG [Nitrospira sp.]
MPSALIPTISDHKPTVLIIDDEAAPRAALTQILRQDFHILTAENARTALAILGDRGVDLVTLDMKLPDCSGSDLLHDIKHAHAATEVIMVTAYGSLQSAMDCIRNGAAGFLLKPFNAPELLTISLQTAQKKMRLDRLRPILTDSTTLWGPEPDCSESWQALADRYTIMSHTGSSTESRSDATSPLVPLISDLLEAKDRHLLNHGSRVSFYATLVGSRLNLPISEQQSLAIGALVHDLDLISLPNSHVLTAEPDPQIHHPDLGARMGRAMGLSADAVQIIALHHERWDGTGYPFGLQEERTPLLARIVGIAQVFDDLTAAKPEPTSLSNNDALQQIEQLAGSAFDPTLTELFCHIMREQPQQQ